MIKTKTVSDRRAISFATMDDILADIESISDGAGASGNWTAAQIVDHVSRVITSSIDGFDFKVPFLLRMLGRQLKGRMLKNGFSPGYKIPGGAPSFVPDPGVTWDAAIGLLRREVERVRDGARMTEPSPLFGPMAHEEWVMLHCRHAELHFSFIRPE